jgi:hypothetical protein
MRRRGAVVPLKRRGPLVERIDFKFVRVYLDDIKEIFSILRELTDDVRIQADDYVATEPQDLLEIHSDTINELTIVATQPSVTVTLSDKTAALEATDVYDDNSALGALKRIEERMRHRRRPLKKVLWTTNKMPSLVLIALLLGLMSLVLAVAALGSDPQNPPPPGTTTISYEEAIGIWVTTALAIALSVIMTARRQATVIPRFQKDAPPFLERNKDDIAISAIFTVIGGVLGIVGTLLLQALVDR